MSRLLRNIFMFVVYAYLYIPIIILVTNSFNEDRYGLSWKGFSWNWYERLFNNDTLIQAAFHSVTIAFFAATLATIVGGLTAIALYRYRFRGKQAVKRYVIYRHDVSRYRNGGFSTCLIHGCRDFVRFLVITIGARNILSTLCYRDNFLA